MSRSPERISSYRRHFEDSSSSSYQVRLSSPSPTRRDVRLVSSSFPCRTGSGIVRVESGGRRTASAARRGRMAGAGVGAGALVCIGPNGEPAIDLDAAAAENQDFLNTRTTERQEMVVLNDRLAAYIDKVRSLEQQNKLLEAEIEAYQNRFVSPSGLRLLYEEQLKELKKVADQMRVQRDVSVAAKDSTAAQLEAIKIKYEEALELRRKAELDIEAFRPDVDQATSSRIALEKKLEQLEAEAEFLKRVHQQEIEELMKQLYSAHVCAQSAFALPDLASALKQIQKQYDDIAAKNLQEMDSWYKNKFEGLTSKTARHLDKVRSIRDGIAGAKKDIQSKDRDLEALRSRNEALEARIRETQEKHKKELEELQARIEALQLELKSTKEKITLHLREYQDLLNVKMALEMEITTYRKLIEGEDLRLSGMMQTLSLPGCGATAMGGGRSFGGGGTGGAGGMMGGGGGMGGGAGGGVAAGGQDDRKGPASRTGGADVGGVYGVGGVGGGVGGARGPGGLAGGAGGVAAGDLDGSLGFRGEGGVGAAAGPGGRGSGVGGAIGGGAGGSRGTEGGGDVGVALSRLGKTGGGQGDTNGAEMGYGSDGYDVIGEPYAEQAVELTERRTVLIRTVKNDGDVQTDRQEQTYTITGAADDDE